MNKKIQVKQVSVEELMEAIQKFPSSEYRDMWLRWLGEYDEPGYYNRLAGMKRSAKFAYNHLFNPEMLLWLIQAAGIAKNLVELAEHDYNRAPDDVRKQAAAIRKRVPWDELERTLW